MKSRKISPECQELIDEIESLCEKLTLLPPSEILCRSQKLSEYRAKSSSTLQNGSNESWKKANEYVSQKITASIFPTWEDIENINKICNPSTGGQLRNCPVYIGNHKACSPETLPVLIQAYINDILSFNNVVHSLITACHARYWLVTIHPFIDGNGRTSNLICDWILALNGYLPVSFGLKLDAHIGGWGGRSHFSDLNYACLKTLLAIKHTYQIL